MTKLFLAFALISSMLFAQTPNLPRHNHRRLWIDVALVAAVVGATILAEHEIRGNQSRLAPAWTPAPKFALTSPAVVSPIPAPTSLASIQTLCSMGFCTGLNP